MILGPKQYRTLIIESGENALEKFSSLYFDMGTPGIISLRGIRTIKLMEMDFPAKAYYITIAYKGRDYNFGYDSDLKTRDEVYSKLKAKLFGDKNENPVTR